MQKDIYFYKYMTITITIKVTLNEVFRIAIINRGEHLRGGHQFWLHGGTSVQETRSYSSHVLPKEPIT